MNRTHKLAVVLSLLVGAAFAAASGAASPPAPSASASASMSAAPPPPPLLSTGELPEEPGPAPKAGDWKDAQLVRPNRGESSVCKLKVLRGWLRIECKDWLGVTLVAGEPKDVRVWVSGDPFDWEKSEAERKSLALAELPLRRGQSYVVTFLKPDWLYEGATTGEADTFHVVWNEGREPIVVVSPPGQVHSF
jgi:hypothetical protein